MQLGQLMLSALLVMYMMKKGIQHTIKQSIMINIILDRKSTRLNSSHQIISYAVFCLKKKKKKKETEEKKKAQKHT